MFSELQHIKFLWNPWIQLIDKVCECLYIIENSRVMKRLWILLLTLSALPVVMSAQDDFYLRKAGV